MTGVVSDRDKLDETIGPDGMQRNYLVLSEEERAKGFVRPVRTSYKHVGAPGSVHRLPEHFEGNGCHTVTTMGRELAETYARQPDFYGGTFCVSCGTHLPVGADGEFVWLDGSRVGT